MALKYKIILDWCEDNKLYIAEVPELAGCKADGKTYFEVLQNSEKVIEEWIETAQLLKRVIPVPEGRLTFA